MPRSRPERLPPASMNKARETARSAARAYEATLPPEQRKQLGQYFTGLPLGKLLAHLALDEDTRTVLDPMAGHGDLLDATWEAARERGIALGRLDGIEIDEATAEACRNRLSRIAAGDTGPTKLIVSGDAFDPASVKALPSRAYDLVITNPPYVRYQSHNGNGARGGTLRASLAAIISRHLSAADRDVWSALIEGYSGLSDLSVPVWLLAAAMVRPHGRLALVVPATWRSRDYADIIRYLMLRCFVLEYVVEDQQPGWFSDALVRTHLIVARRLPTADIAIPVGLRTNSPDSFWLHVAPEAAAAGSLVGTAFEGTYPEVQFSAWVRAACPGTKHGITVRRFDLDHEWTALRRRIKPRRWYQGLENESDGLPLFATGGASATTLIPDKLKDVLPGGLAPSALITLEEAGISIGQGLRTGCNKFFYVDTGKSVDPDRVMVETSVLFGGHQFPMPIEVLRPVLRRQAELAPMAEGNVPPGRVLDLRRWVLPEDWQTVTEALPAYAARGESPPNVMPTELANYVRMAAAAHLESLGKSKRIPELSAVRTNIRVSRDGHVTPLFWYMLPDFAPRHLPAAFVARINHGLPWVEANLDPPLLVDANFSTLWAPRGGWTRHAIKALLNSIWCRIFMEALGTPLGGGALKLEATHLRQMAVPALSDEAKAKLDAAGKRLAKDASAVQSEVDNIVLNAIIAQSAQGPSAVDLARVIAERAHMLSGSRQKAPV